MESAYYNDLSQEMFTGLANLAASDMAQYVLISEYVKIARVLRRHCFLVIHYIKSEKPLSIEVKIHTDDKEIIFRTQCLS